MKNSLFLDPENRPYFGTDRQICEQLHNGSFAHEDEPTLDAFISGALSRLGGIGLPTTPANLITALVTVGQLRPWPAGAKLFPAIPEIEARADMIARASILTRST